ncbi:MAG: RdgB/HAM1 family non-canonical purine NTP pyrophosphatase [Rhizobiaceae bacterium]
MRALDGNELVVATHNQGKVREIAGLIEPYGLTAKSTGELGLPEPAETGTTFRENAFIKAFAAAKATGLPALADDSGLCVDALDGDPGVYTADWAEQPDGSRDWLAAMTKVEDKLQAAGAVNADQRRATFFATLCLCWPDGHAEYFVGEAPGTLVWPPRGEHGFGYDPVFRPNGHDRTFAEMLPEEKYARGVGADGLGLSHRTRAFELFARAVFGG